MDELVNVNKPMDFVRHYQGNIISARQWTEICVL